MRTTGFLAAVALLAAVGCNESKEGAYGNIQFTPDECGLTGGCDFDDSVGVGGAININIRGIDGFSTAGVTLVSDDPGVMTVAAIGDVGGRPTWEAIGVSPGVARITAIDASEEIVDFLEVGVQSVGYIGMDNFAGDAVGPTSDESYDEIWQVNANEATSFYVVPYIGDAAPIMGRYTYQVYMDSTMDAGLINTTDVDDGYLYFNVPAGDYAVSYVSDADDSITLDILIQAVAAQ